MFNSKNEYLRQKNYIYHLPGMPKSVTDDINEMVFQEYRNKLKSNKTRALKQKS